MAITFVGASATPHAASNANGTPTLPVGTVQDDWLFYVMSANDLASSVGTFSAPASYTALFHSPHTGGVLALYMKKFNTGDTAQATTYAGGGTGDCVQGCYFSYRGVHASSPIDAQGTNTLSGATSANIGPITGITPTVSDACIMVIGNKSDDTTGTVSALTGESLTWVVAKDFHSSLGNDGLTCVQHAIISGAPVAIANKTMTVTGTTNAVNWQGVMLSLQPGAAGGGSSPVYRRYGRGRGAVMRSVM